MADVQEPEPGTPLPWRLDRHTRASAYFGNIVGMTGECDDSGKEYVRTITVQTKHGGYEEAEANARYIVHACNSYLDLTTRLAAAEAREARLTRALATIEDWCCPVFCVNCRDNKETAATALTETSHEG